MKQKKTLWLGLIALFFQACSYLPQEVHLISGVELKETADYISLSPTSIAIKPTGIMFYAGGFVDAHAYIELLQQLTVIGYQVVILKSCGNLAIMSSNKSQEYLHLFPSVQQWLIGGHSVGGVTACIDVHKHPEDYVGVILLAAYPSEDNNLSTWDRTVLSLSAEHDGRSTRQKVNANKYLLPPALDIANLVDMPASNTARHCIFHEISGGIHSYFGSYGYQNGDGTATISQAAQQQETIDYIISFLNANNW